MKRGKTKRNAFNHTIEVENPSTIIGLDTHIPQYFGSYFGKKLKKLVVQWYVRTNLWRFTLKLSSMFVKVV
jgi:hypothetical protein